MGTANDLEVREINTISAAEGVKTERQEITHLGSLFATFYIQGVEQRLDFFADVAR